MKPARPVSAEPEETGAVTPPLTPESTKRRVSTERLLSSLLGVLVVAAVLLASQGCREGLDRPVTDPAPARALPVAIAHPEPVSGYVRRRTYTGEVRARRTSALGFERAGRVIRIAVDEGQPVGAAAPLAFLERDRLEAERTRLLAARREAAAMLAEMRAGPRESVVEAAREAVADLRAQVELSGRMRIRREKLLAEKHISDEEYDEIVTRLASLRAQLRGAEDRLGELVEGTRAERIEAQEARVATLDAEVALLDLELKDTTLVAPYAGRVAKRHLDEGSVVAAGSPVLTLVEDGFLEAWVGVPPGVAATLPVRSRQTVVAAGREHQAPVRARLPDTDTRTRTQMVVLELPVEAARTVVPGVVATLALAERVDTDGLWVPASALTRGVRGLWAVFVIERADLDTSVAVRHPVEVLHAESDRVLVRGTIGPDSPVIVGNTEKIAPGQSVVAVEGEPTGRDAQ